MGTFWILWFPRSQWWTLKKWPPSIDSWWYLNQNQHEIAHFIRAHPIPNHVIIYTPLWSHLLADCPSRARVKAALNSKIVALSTRTHPRPFARKLFRGRRPKYCYFRIYMAGETTSVTISFSCWKSGLIQRTTSEMHNGTELLLPMVQRACPRIEMPG